MIGGSPLKLSVLDGILGVRAGAEDAVSESEEHGPFFLEGGFGALHAWL